MSEEEKTFSVMVRVRRVTQEDAYVAVPLTEAVTREKEDGSIGIDPDAILAEAVRVSQDQRVQWAVESSDTGPHPVQGPMPENRQCFDAFYAANE